jgi:two-component system response regulator YesN
MLKLMIVDDEPIILAGIRDMIEIENTAFTKIVTANDGIDALEKMAYFSPDLIITDIQMPEMDGLTLIREAQKKNVSRFIILSGYDEFTYAREGIRLQVKEYLLKPINQLELAGLLKKIAIEILEEKQSIQQETLEAGQPQESSNENIRMLIDYIKTNYMKDISLSDAASLLDQHPVYVGQFFKKAMGNTFNFHLNEVRVEKAKQMLLVVEGMSLDKIAKHVGFENRRTFYKVFRKYTGQTPGDFREKLKKEAQTPGEYRDGL